MPATLTDHGSLTSHEPATGVPVGRFPVDDEAAVSAAVARAREGAAWWWGLGFAGRRARLLAWKVLLARRAEEIVALVQRETGKPRSDAMIELLLGLDRLDWSARHAGRVLGGERRRPNLLALNQRLRVERVPKGVVGAITPWNFPLFITLQTVASALAAGNAVVHKPSEHTPSVGAWLVETLAEVTPEQSIMELVTGFGDTGAALCRAPVDHLAFTGSPATGRAVMTAGAESLTPVTLELGGVDAAIVDADADLARAARGVVYPAMLNAGQMCIGVERAYVSTAVYDEFCAAVADSVRDVTAGAEQDAAYGPMTVPEQVEVVRDHLDDALARGARPLVGGPASIRPPFVDPIVLVDVPDDARLLHEETFGPMLPILPVDDASEAVARTNAVATLGVHVWGQANAAWIARHVHADLAAINGALSYAMAPSAPFGGVGGSGFGRMSGPEGLRELSRARTIARERVRLPFDLASFEQPDWLLPRLERVLRWRHGARASARER